MSNTILERLHHLSGYVANYAEDHKKAFVSSCAVVTALVACLPRVLQDYRIYMSYGENGSPLTIRGWLVSTVILRSLSFSDLFSTNMYERSDDKRTWLDESWPRKARDSRPTLGPHPAPQRQLNQIPSEASKKDLKDRFYALAKKNEKLVQLKPSFFEKQTESMFLSDRVQASQIAADTAREIAHVHSTGDHSVHVTLSPQDCKKVIEAGWGQRHPLDGVKTLKYMLGAMISQQYILLYAPRNPEEISVVLDVVKASIGYMTESREVQGLDRVSS
ncbi:hypothetical protein MMC07_003916 [Pseudocyphellaria aurata]|nr:hypothetical protein [Pseudocyphellaria aurata]